MKLVDWSESSISVSMEGQVGFFLCFFVSFGPKAGVLPCCLLLPNLYSENYNQQKLLNACSFGSIDSWQLNQTVALRIYLPFLSHCGTTDNFSNGKSGPICQFVQVTSCSFLWHWRVSCYGMKGRPCQF